MNRKSIFVLIGLVVALIFAGTSGAVASKLIDSFDIKNDTIKSVDLKDGRAVGESDLKPSLAEKVNLAATPGEQGPKGDVGDVGPQGPKGDTGATGGTGPQGPAGRNGIDGTATVYDSTSETSVIANIGGSFKTRSTEIDTIQLPAGKYILTADGFFHSTASTSGMTRLQLALRVGKTVESFGEDVGTCFTAAASVLADRETTCTTTRTVTFSSPTTVQVIAFGYADDQGSADGGKFTVVSYLTAASVN